MANNVIGVTNNSWAWVTPDAKKIELQTYTSISEPAPQKKVDRRGFYLGWKIISPQSQSNKHHTTIVLAKCI